MTTYVHDTPQPVLVMAALCLLAAGGCLLGALFPMSSETPVALGFWMAGLGGAMALGDLTLRARMPAWALHLQLAIVTASATLLVAESQTGVGAMTTAVAFPWFAAYAAVFFTRPEAVVHAGLLTAGLIVGLVATPAHVSVTAIAVVSVSLWNAVVALSSVVGRMRELASTDPLTGLLNRAGLFAAARREMARAARAREPLTMLAIDLDDLKAVNDAQGHLVGDRLLASAAQAWLDALRGQDVLARTGGDEFVLLAPSTTEAQADHLVERLRAAHPAHWSAGASTWEPGEPFDAWLGRADAALYAEKARRRGARPPVVASP